MSRTRGHRRAKLPMPPRDRLCNQHHRPDWYCFLMREVYGPAPWERAEQQRRFKERRRRLDADQPLEHWSDLIAR